MKNQFIERPANKSSISKRKLVCGVGINDADYVTRPSVGGNRMVCPFYMRWHNMIERCYSQKYQFNQPTYIGCSVCPEWIYFSNFKEWMITQDWEGLELDKDIIKPGNKIYHPKFCAFVNRSLNALLIGGVNSRSKLPPGVSWSESNNKFRSSIVRDGKKLHLGYYKTIERASNSYAKAKYKIILDVASKQASHRIKNGLLLHVELLKNQIALAKIV